MLWAAQTILALTFIWAGMMKLLNPGDLPFAWVKENPKLVWLTGFLDLVGGIGIILPDLMRVRREFSRYAAYGIIALMAVATIFHVLRGEAKDIGFNFFMLFLAIFVAWGRRKTNRE